jgi:hypothetical protein
VQKVEGHVIDHYKGFGSTPGELSTEAPVDKAGKTMAFALPDLFHDL